MAMENKATETIRSSHGEFSYQVSFSVLAFIKDRLGSVPAALLLNEK